MDNYHLGAALVFIYHLYVVVMFIYQLCVVLLFVRCLCIVQMDEQQTWCGLEPALKNLS